MPPFHLCFFILFILSPWLFVAISSHCHSFLIPFLSCSLNYYLPLLLATSLVFSALLDLISLSLVSLSHLHSHDAFFSLPLSCTVFSCSSFSMYSPLWWNSSVYCIFFFFLFLFPTLFSCIPDPHRTMFLFFFFRSIFFFRMDRRFIPLMLGWFKISQVLNAFKRERFEYRYENIGKIIYLSFSKSYINILNINRYYTIVVCNNWKILMIIKIIH